LQKRKGRRVAAAPVTSVKIYIQSSPSLEATPTYLFPSLLPSLSNNYSHLLKKKLERSVSCTNAFPGDIESGMRVFT